MLKLLLRALWAMGHGTCCSSHLCHCLQTLSVQQQQTGDEDAFAYNNSLRRGIFEAYSGIITGMSREKVNAYLTNYALVRPPHRWPPLLRNLCG